MKTTLLIFVIIVLPLGRSVLGMNVSIGGDQTVCVGTEVTFYGSVSKANPSVQWSGATQVQGQPLVAKKKFTSTGTFTVQLTATKGRFSGTATCKVTVIAVTVPGDRDINAAAAGYANPPTQTATATGTPSGGTFAWTCSTNITILSGADTATITYIGNAGGNGWIEATYTKAGGSCTSRRNVTVHQPTSMTCVAAYINGYTTQGGQLYQEYYHVVSDNFGQIMTSGAATETVVSTPPGSPMPSTFSGSITYWGAVTGNGAATPGWRGGAALKDTIAPSMNYGTYTYAQTIYVLGWKIGSYTIQVDYYQGTITKN